ncbi:DUF5336 domain-containing protein [Mycobacterium sherrisii]|uniref:DUF5336 domain-containing protein n=1 Tax=Mycobacterium sherrisii TaxID=243061 RepID=UPI002DDD105E|nr:DUF5336 domain-containing protein [Mycobacterium sherrisii]MEC4764901.1 DUF5336 domain-containing protein [Mycobacterium sherrisii]
MTDNSRSAEDSLTAPSDALNRSLWAVVAVLGPATFVVGLFSPGPLDYSVRFSVLAAAVAAVGLLPRQTLRAWVVVALAVTGYVDALAGAIKPTHTGWPMIVITVLNSLQSVVAVGALLRETKIAKAARPTSVSEPSAYARLVAAYQAYATQYQLFSAQYGSAGQAEGDATAGAHAGSEQESFAAMQARYARHGIAGSVRQSRGVVAPPMPAPAVDSGVPGVNRAATENEANRRYCRDGTVGGVEQASP